MKKNCLGKTGIYVSQLGFGASPFGNIYNTKVNQKSANSMIEIAIENGINYFDVAPYYGLGLAEEKLGKALPKNTNNLIISTKVGRYGVNEFDFSIKKIKESVTTSLKRLKRDYIDILICHDIEFVDKKIILDQALPYLNGRVGAATQPTNAGVECGHTVLEANHTVSQRGAPRVMHVHGDLV